MSQQTDRNSFAFASSKPLPQNARIRVGNEFPLAHDTRTSLLTLRVSFSTPLTRHTLLRGTRHTTRLTTLAFKSQLAFATSHVKSYTRLTFNLVIRVHTTRISRRFTSLVAALSRLPNSHSRHAYSPTPRFAVTASRTRHSTRFRVLLNSFHVQVAPLYAFTSRPTLRRSAYTPCVSIASRLRVYKSPYG